MCNIKPSEVAEMLAGEENSVVRTEIARFILERNRLKKSKSYGKVTLACDVHGGRSHVVVDVQERHEDGIL